ncbi:hypothetical protein [Oricola sp.]|uniref:hypothetical protein n=1 Tax=Oricola sp. TaxID=1979950 RepID=UPI0025E13FCB|nr:hypothetical protein [Oricola sp.]MCI5074327.1 hypothetical protein [Oricola sp.]
MKGDDNPHCHGVVTERREGDTSTYTLTCTGDCEKGECRVRSEKDHHGTVTEWCACDDGERGCNIYISTDARGKQRIDCFTLGCDEGYECRLVELDSAESEGVKIIRWVCACVKV